METRQVSSRGMLLTIAMFTGVAVSSGAALAQSTFTGLGQFPESTGNLAFGLSGDGQAVAGALQFGGQERGFRWTEAGGFENLGALPNFPEERTRAYALNHDGSVVVGSSIASAPMNSKAIRWTQPTGFVSLGAGMATTCSSDGSMVGGGDRYHADWPLFKIVTLPIAFRWTQAEGTRCLAAAWGASPA